MENLFDIVLKSGNAAAILSFVACYFIICLQRKSTGEERNKREAQLQAEINEAKAKAAEIEDAAKRKIEETQAELEEQMIQYNTEKQLMQKDISYLLSENDGMKADVKEMKATMNQMAMSIERLIAAVEALKKG